MSTAVLHQFQITTTAATRRAAHRTATWTIPATNVADAEQAAVERHTVLAGYPGRGPFLGEVRAHVDLVDGVPPEDCPHTVDRTVHGFVWRSDGGRDCHACAGDR